MQQHRKVWPLRVMCKALKASRSGYYAWQKRQPSARFHRRTALSAAIREVHETSRRTYGSPRISAALHRNSVVCCVNTVAKIMREDGLKAKIVRRFKVTTDSSHGVPAAPNHLDRRFERSRPNDAWVSDFTFIATKEGWLYLATELDLYSRRIVGWAMGERLDTELAASALAMAVTDRRPSVGLIHHSDRGCQYASGSFQSLLTAHGMVCSMSRKGDVYDNAPMESFFGTLKRELVRFARFATREQARQDVFEWIEVFYNRQRLHSTLGYRSPAEFEADGKFS